MTMLRFAGFSTGYSKGKGAVVVPEPGKTLKAFAQLQRFAKQNGAMKRTFHIQRREFPCMARRRKMTERVYYAKWHWLKYCTQVVRYSVNRGLPLPKSGGNEIMDLPPHKFADGVDPPLHGSGRLNVTDVETIPFRTKLAAMHREHTWQARSRGDRRFSEEQLRDMVAMDGAR